MKFSTQNFLFSFVLIICLLIIGCPLDNENGGGEDENHASIVLHFDHKVGDKNLVLDTDSYTNKFGNSYKVNDLRYMLSEIILMGHKDEDTLFRSNKFIFVDESAPHTLTQKIMGVPSGVHYHEIRFVFGILPHRNNFTEVEANIDSIPKGFRGDQVSRTYHFLQINGKYMDTSDTERGFTFHMGNFSPEAVNNIHHFNVDFNVYANGREDKAIHATPSDGNEIHVYLTMDVSKWFENPNLIDLNKVNATMFNPDQQDLLSANGADVFEIDSSSIENVESNHDGHDH